MSKLYNLLLTLPLILVLFCGCENSAVKKTELSNRAKEVQEVLKDVSKDDCLTLYYLFSGCADYTEKYTGITRTNQINGLFRTVKTRYGKPDGWLDKDGSDNDISDLIEKYLKTEFGDDFIKPKEFDEDSKKKFVSVYRDLANGSLSAYKGKK